jgi:hypothetical protein
MTNRDVGWLLFAFTMMTLMLATASIFASPVLAVKKNSSSSDKTIHKITPSKTTTTTTTHHVKGVKVFRVHTVPSKVAVGDTFGLRGIVFNNSTATITFANGTCTSPVSITFNKNVKIETQASPATCKAQQVTLRSGGQSHILSPNLSGIIYRATAPGMTNATMIFKYGVETTTSKSPVSDSISRVFTFNVQPGAHQHAATSTNAAITTTKLEPSPLKLLIPQARTKTSSPGEDFLHEKLRYEIQKM